jgi:hypothetical protein
VEFPDFRADQVAILALRLSNRTIINVTNGYSKLEASARKPEQFNTLVGTKQAFSQGTSIYTVKHGQELGYRDRMYQIALTMTRLWMVELIVACLCSMYKTADLCLRALRDQPLSSARS